MLETIWFVLWGILWTIYFALDGFDLGLGTIMPLLAKNETDKRIIYNAQYPYWDGNEVWLITAGGVTYGFLTALRLSNIASLIIGFVFFAIIFVFTALLIRVLNKTVPPIDSPNKYKGFSGASEYIF